LPEHGRSAGICAAATSPGAPCGALAGACCGARRVRGQASALRR
jgi:hypothetical protein